MSNKKDGFNQKEYNKEYTKKNYKKPSIYFSIEDYNNIALYCKDFNLPFSEYVKMCCKYCLDNVHIDELKQYKK